MRAGSSRSRSSRPVRAARAALVAAGALALATSASLALIGSAPSVTAAEVAGSTVEVTQGPFDGLRLSVSQTRNLTSQVVEIRWSGAAPTVPTIGTASHSYLQLMQCWGDDPAGTEANVTPGLADPSSAAAGYGPDRTQCQYGAIGTREIDPGTLVDPLDDLDRNFDCFDHDNDPATPDQCRKTYVPFESVTGSDPVIDPQANVYFDVNTSNEINVARTRSNGEGLAYFEVQTLRQAPGLGCGAAQQTSSGIKGRACWLVVVPRGNLEVNGTPVGPQEANREMYSSPLSETAWKNRIVIPLTFAPIGNVCPIGASERRVIGSEVATDAVTRWQPTLCAGGDRIFSFNQVSEPVVRMQLAGAQSTLALVNSEVDDLPDAVYAPVLAGGLTFASLIERQVRGNEAESVLERAGERMPELRLTPRLVAKLITQSYLAATAAPGELDKMAYLYRAGPDGRPLIENGELALAPRTLLDDPEFEALNPDYADFPSSRFPVADVVLPVGASQANELVWRWLLSDSDAKAFLTGVPDEWGMRVNPYYVMPGTTTVDDAPRDFPKRDEICSEPAQAGNESSRRCTNNVHPYVADYETGARLAGRGDDGAVANWDPQAAPARFKANGPAAIGERGVLVLTTTALAQRYGLRSAALQNASGEFVAPTDSSIAEAIRSARTARSAQVLEPDPGTAADGAYPLTTVTYAVTVPKKVPVETAIDYAEFIRYAALDGQVPGVSDGRLPYGYAPLPNVLSVEADRAADRIVAMARAAAKPTPTPAPSTSAPASPSASATPQPTESGSGNSGLPPVDGGLPPIDPIAPPVDPVSPGTDGVPDAGAGGSDAGAPQGSGVPVTYLVAAETSSLGRWAIPVLAALGAVGLAAGLALPRMFRRV